MQDLDFVHLPMHEMEFVSRGECVGMDPKMFFPDDGGRVHAEARRACERCAERELCLVWALKHEEFGFWGGTTPEERRKLRRRRP